MAVPPNYKTVTCYLPPELAEQLKAYCFEHEITRKNKQGELSPSWGTGIVEALKLFFSSDTKSVCQNPLIIKDKQSG